MVDFTFDIRQFIVGQYMMAEIGTDKYNVTFTEFYISAEHEAEINEIKGKDKFPYFELSDGSIHFSSVNYTTEPTGEENAAEPTETADTGTSE